MTTSTTKTPISTSEFFDIFKPGYKQTRDPDITVLLAGKNIYSVVITNKTFSFGILSLKNMEIPFGLSFDGCDFYSEVNIQNTIVTNFGIQFNSCDFKNRLLRITGVSIGNIGFHNCEINSMYCLYNWSDNFEFGDNCKINKLKIHNCYFNSISFNNYIKELDISFSMIQRLKVYERSQFNKLIYQDCFINSLDFEIGNKEYDHYEIRGCRISRLKFGYDIIFKGKVRIRNLEVLKQTIEFNRISIGNFAKNENVTISELFDLVNRNLPLPKTPVTLPLMCIESAQYQNYSSKFEPVNFGNSCMTYFHLSDVSFEDFILENVEMEKFDKVIIEKTNLSTMRTFDTTFISSNIVGSNMNRYRLFTDLYSSSVSTNDHRLQLKYHKEYSDALKKAIESDKENVHDDSGIWSLRIRSVIADYSTDWVRGMLFLLILLTFTYTITMIPFIYKAENHFSIRHLSYSIQFLNPLHRQDFLDYAYSTNKPSTSDWFLFWDSLSRLLHSIVLFEIIQAFRKYRRK